MSFAKNSVCLILAGLLVAGAAPAAFAQAGGGDVPKDAKKQGEKEQPGSTGATDKGAMKKDDGSMKKSDDKM